MLENQQFPFACSHCFPTTDQSENIVFTHLDQLYSDDWDMVPSNLPEYPSHNEVRCSLMNLWSSLVNALID
jgi:hypothetical protein